MDAVVVVGFTPQSPSPAPVLVRSSDGYLRDALISSLGIFGYQVQPMSICPLEQPTRTPPRRLGVKKPMVCQVALDIPLLGWAGLGLLGLGLHLVAAVVAHPNVASWCHLLGKCQLLLSSGLCLCRPWSCVWLISALQLVA